MKRWVAFAAAWLVACSSNPSTQDAGNDGGTLDDGGADASSGDPLITYDSLAAAYDALQGGAMDVPVSVEGREHYVRTVDGSGNETDSLYLDGYVIWRAVHTGSTSHVVQDQNGDGKMDWTDDVVRGATDSDRTAVISSDPAGIGTPTSRRTMTQTAATPNTVHVKVEANVGGTWVTEEETDTNVVQGVEAPVIVDSVSCYSLSDTIQSGMEQGITQGIAKMQEYGVRDIVNGITTLLVERGVRVHCDPNVYYRQKDCAQASIFDTLTHSRIGGLMDSRVQINVAPADACVKPYAFFHELVHIVTGLTHSPSLNPKDKESKATDRVYSCQDVAFEADNNTAPTTKCECATCLKTKMEDPRCSSFDKCPADIVITSAKCTTVGTCQCDVYTGNLDVLSVSGFAHGPPGSTAVIPNMTGDAKIDCGGWAKDPATFGAASGCLRDPDAASRMDWSTVGSYLVTCSCGPSPQPVDVSLVYGADTLAYDHTSTTCP